jgi:uncharacterized protein (DUF2062 family)
MGLMSKIRQHPRLAALLQIDDTVHSISLGAAVGMFVGLTPTVGIQMYVAAMICLLLRCNRLWAIAMVWISNPITMVPMYYGFYVLGSFILNIERIYNFHYFKNLFEIILATDGFFEMMKMFVRQMLSVGYEVVGPMFFGGAVLGLVFSVPTYFVVFHLVHQNRRRKDSKRASKSSSEASVSTETSET